MWEFWKLPYFKNRTKRLSIFTKFFQYMSISHSVPFKFMHAFIHQMKDAHFQCTFSVLILLLTFFPRHFNKFYHLFSCSCKSFWFAVIWRLECQKFKILLKDFDRFSRRSKYQIMIIKLPKGHFLQKQFRKEIIFTS